MTLEHLLQLRIVLLRVTFKIIYVPHYTFKQVHFLDLGTVVQGYEAFVYDIEKPQLKSLSLAQSTSTRAVHFIPESKQSGEGKCLEALQKYISFQII